MKVTKKCPLLFLVKVGCRHVGNLESEEDEIMEFELSWVRSRINTLRSHMIWVRAVGLYVEGSIVVKFL